MLRVLLFFVHFTKVNKLPYDGSNLVHVTLCSPEAFKSSAELEKNKFVYRPSSDGSVCFFRSFVFSDPVFCQFNLKNMLWKIKNVMRPQTSRLPGFWAISVP